MVRDDVLAQAAAAELGKHAVPVTLEQQQDGGGNAQHDADETGRAAHAHKEGTDKRG